MILDNPQCTQTYDRSIIKAKNAYKCEAEGCDKTFTAKPSLMRHVQQNHSENQCNKCEDSFTSPLKVRLHMERTHDAVAKHKCSLCEEIFSCVEYLHGHLRRHKENGDDIIVDVDPISCNVCNRSFRYRANLSVHKKTCKSPPTTRPNPIKCNVPACDKTFSDFRAMRVHVDAVHVGKMHVCPLCNKSFGYQTNLSRHQKKCNATPSMC